MKDLIHRIFKPFLSKSKPQVTGPVVNQRRRGAIGLGAMGLAGALLYEENALAQTWQPVASGSSGGSPQVQVFNASGTWTCPAGVTKVWVTAIGGGGAGYHASGTSNSPGGGGSGDMCLKKELNVVPGTGYTITIGGGGATNGAAGTATSFGALLTLAGGGGGNSGGGGAGGGTFGSDGDPGSTSSNILAYGGFALFGGGTISGSAPANSGAGGRGRNSTSGFGAGGSGCLIVEWFA